MTIAAFLQEKERRKRLDEINLTNQQIKVKKYFLLKNLKRIFTWGRDRFGLKTRGGK